MDEMSKPKRPPPMHAKDPTIYCKLTDIMSHLEGCKSTKEIKRPLTGFEAILALYFITGYHQLRVVIRLEEGTYTFTHDDNSLPMCNAKTVD